MLVIIFLKIILIPFIIFYELQVTDKDVFLLSLLGIFFTAIPVVLFTKSMQTLKARQVSSISSLEIVYGIILAIIFLHEIPALRTIFGGIIVFGVTLYLTFQVKNKKSINKNKPSLKKKEG